MAQITETRCTRSKLDSYRLLDIAQVCGRFTARVHSEQVVIESEVYVLKFWNGLFEL